jgi:hypothetical protein
MTITNLNPTIEKIISGGQNSLALSKSPKTVNEAVDQIIDEMDLKVKAMMANMTESELATLELTLGLYIQKQLDKWSANESLTGKIDVRDEVIP